MVQRLREFGAIITFDKFERTPTGAAEAPAANAEQNGFNDTGSAQNSLFELASYSSRRRQQEVEGSSRHRHGNQESQSTHHRGHDHAGTARPADAHPGHSKPATDAPNVKKTPPAKPTETSEAGPSKYLPSIAGFTKALNSYWQRISHARSHREFLTEFPPVYKGMDAPHPTPPVVPPAPESIKGSGRLPSLNDLYGASKDLNRIVKHDRTQSDFHPLDVSEAEFKRRYAEESVNVGKEYNLNKATISNLVKRIYAFEDGGWGTYNTLSSMPQALMDDDQKVARGNFHPLSSAIGYNQLLMKDTVNDIAQHGAAISGRLDALAAAHPDRAQTLHEKAKLVSELQDVLLHRTGPDAKVPTDKHKRFYASSSKVEEAVQSLNLDGDIGPVIQSQELNNLLKYARDNKFGDYLNTRVALETSHAADYDKLTPQQKAAAADQILALVKSADLDPSKPETVAAFVNTKESLRKKFIDLNLKGSPSEVEREHLSADEFKMMNSQILTIRRYGGDSGPLSPEARTLLDRVTFDYFGGFSADRLQAAAIELANLAGMGSAQMMLTPENANLPTSNFFARPGYQGNPVTSRRSANELLLQIYRIMHGPNSDPGKPGMKQFNDAFNSLPP